MSVYPSGVSLRHPDASPYCPGVFLVASAALQVARDVYPEIIRKQQKASVMFLWDPYHPERDLCRIRKSLTFSTFPPTPHNPHGILVTFRI